MLGRKKKAQTPTEPTPEELAILSRCLRHYPAGTKLNFGAPVRCPQCADFGMVTEVNPAAGVTSFFCMQCGIDWSLTRRAIRRAPEARPHVAVGGLGDMFGSVDLVQPGPVDVALERDLHLLLVEDDEADADLIKTILSCAPKSIGLSHAFTRREGEAIASAGGVDLVLLDLGLPESTGLSTLSNWQVSAPPSPVVVVSGDSRQGVIEGARQIGAADFLHKQSLVPILDRGAEGTAELVDFFRLVVATGTSGPAAAPAPDPWLARDTF